jgi:hypothetical protein
MVRIDGFDSFDKFEKSAIFIGDGQTDLQTIFDGQTDLPFYSSVRRQSVNIFCEFLTKITMG